MVKRFNQFLFERLQDEIIKKYGLTDVSNSVGFSEKDQKWYGWSHRAIMGFGIGDRIFEEDYGDDKTPFLKHGSKECKTLEDAKKSANAFSDYIS